MNSRKWMVAAASLVVLIGLCLLGLFFKFRPGGTALYFNELSDTPGTEWSNRKTSQIETDGRIYLGKFGRDKITLSLDRLARHQLVRVSFDLFLMQSWDGASRTYGESRWSLDVVDGPNLIQTTFGNCGFFTDNNVQNFPDNRPFGKYPAWTGSTEHETLGTIQSWGGPSRTFDCSSVYHLELAFPHSANDLKLCFQGYKPDKTWGLRNVKVEMLPGLASVSSADYAGLWQQLADKDPVAAFKAKWDLAAGGPATVKFLAGTLSGAVRPPAGSADALRLHRACEVLQVIHTPDADALLNQLGQTNLTLLPRNSELLGAVIAGTQAAASKQRGKLGVVMDDDLKL